MRVTSYTPGKIGVLEIELPREDLLDMYKIVSQYGRIDSDMLDLTTHYGESFDYYVADKVVDTLKAAVEMTPLKEVMAKLIMYEVYMPSLRQILSCADASFPYIERSAGNPYESERISQFGKELKMIAMGLESEEVIQDFESRTGYKVPRFK